MTAPSGYVRLKCIKSSGTQYFDTGFKPNQNTRVVMKARLTVAAASQFYFGVRTSSATASYCFLADKATVLRSDFGSSNASTSAISLTTQVTIDKNKNVCTVNSVALTSSSSTFQSSYNLYLFGVNEGGTAKYFSNLELEECQVYDNGTLIRSYVPYKNAIGTVGLYDEVNGTFGTGAGGAFTGEEITPGSDHLTLVDGTLWGVVGGKTLVGGTGYEIKKGKTLVGGTGYSIEFGEPVMLNISLLDGTPDEAIAYVMVNGTKYTGTQTGIEVRSGDSVVLYAGSAYADMSGHVYLNGVEVSDGADDIYEWTVPGGITTASIEILGYKAGARMYIKTSTVTAANVVVTGSGHSSRCRVIINGTSYYGAASGIVAQHGATITSYVYNESAVNIDGMQVYVGTTGLTTYSWVVPSVSNISIALNYVKEDSVYYGGMRVTTS